MAHSITIMGPAGSSYVRTVRLALEEKGANYAMTELPPPEYKSEAYLRDWHPFGKVPAAVIDGFRIYETQAIVRLIDELYPHPPLQPRDPFQKARMSQVVGIVDCYAWPSMAAGIVWNRFVLPKIFGQSGDEDEARRALPLARTSMDALAQLLEGPYFVGDTLSMADLHVYPILDYLRRVPEGEEMMNVHPNVLDWMERMDTRQSSQLLFAA